MNAWEMSLINVEVVECETAVNFIILIEVELDFWTSGKFLR